MMQSAFPRCSLCALAASSILLVAPIAGFVPVAASAPSDACFAGGSAAAAPACQGSDFGEDVVYFLQKNLAKGASSEKGRLAVSQLAGAKDIDTPNATNATNAMHTTGGEAVIPQGGRLAANLSPLVVAAFLLAALAAFPALGFGEGLVKQARYIAEFTGTFALVFTVGCCVLAGSATWNALAIACTLMVMVAATGPVSGGNLNPAVSFALALTGNLDWSVMIRYWVAQLAGGFSASALVGLLFAPDSLSLAPTAPFLGCHAMISEVMYTFMLCFVVLNCAASKRNNSPTDGNQFYSLAIGFVIVAGGYAVGGVSGAAFNPAVAMALDMKHIGLGWGLCYSVFELIGASLAAAAYNSLRPEEALSGQEFADYTPSLPTKCISEALGTFFLTATVGFNLVTGSASTALSAAASLMCFIYSLGDVSGAHFNPAVTVACIARGATPMNHGAAYIGAQVAAGIAAGALTGLFHAAAPSSATTIALRPVGDYTIASAAFAELFFTFVLAYVVLATATTNRPESQVTKQNFYFGLSIGSCVTAGGFAIGAISGGELNPAVSAGIAAMAGMSPGTSAPLPPCTYLIAFSVMQLTGGFLAATVFRFTHPREWNPAASTDFARALCEFVGTFVLVLTVGCCVITGKGTWNATAIGSVLMVMIYSTGPVSGGNLNPAVSFALGLTGNLKWKEVCKYWAAQLLAGASAGVVFCALLAPRETTLAPVAPFSYGHAAAAEVFYTFMLCFVVLNCAASKRNNPANDGNQFFALAIGFVIIAGGYAAGGISGGCFNPAVALGVDIKHIGMRWGAAWAAAELFGATLAALLFSLVRPEERLTGSDAIAYSPRLSTRCVCEFVGVFMLVLTVGLNIVTSSTAVAWSAAAALMCMIYSLGDISGGHFNPAVTLGVVVGGRGKCSPTDGMAYAVAQLLGGAAAGGVAGAFRGASPETLGVLTLSPGATYGLISAGFAEFFFTAMLSYIVLAVATVKAPESQLTKQSFNFALCIGSCVTAGGFAVGAVSGGELNPAVALGLAMNDASSSMGNLATIALWELCGGLLGALAFRLTHAVEYAPSQKSVSA